MNSAGCKRSIEARFTLLLLLLLISHAAANAADVSTAATHWRSIVTSNDFAVTVLSPANSSSNAAVPTILYLKNLASARVGTESDDSILRDFERDGYRIAIIDFGHNAKARVPFINRDLGKLRDDISSRKFLGDQKVDGAHVFIVPEGCRLKRDVVFYRDPKRTLAMDIVYPSKPSNPTGAIIEFSCDNRDRFGNTSLSICSDTVLDSEATEGFAVAMADHPVAPPYKGLDPMLDCARKIKAAVRTLRAEGPALGLSGRIVPFGFSRGSGMALMLVITDGMNEFEGFGEHTNVSSSVQGAVVLSGRFTYLDLLPDDHMIPRYEKAWGPRKTNQAFWQHEGALDYLSKPTVPIFLSINCSEGPDALHQMDVLRKRLNQLDSPFTFHMDNEPRGHKVPLDPKILGAMNDYFKRQLN